MKLIKWNSTLFIKVVNGKYRLRYIKFVMIILKKPKKNVLIYQNAD